MSSRPATPPRPIAPQPDGAPDAPAPESSRPARHPAAAGEAGGPSGPEPTRFGDWEKNGRCVDF